VALSTKANRFYPSIPNIAEDSESHTNALLVIKEAIETHERRNNSYLKSFVRFEELVDLGLITADGTLVSGAGGGIDDAPVDGDVYGRQDAAWTTIAITALEDVIDTFSGLADGQVLTYDTTNGWQNETPVAGVTTFAALTDTDTTGLTIYHLTYWDGSDWVPSGDLTWDGTKLQLANTSTINWLDAVGASIKMLEFVDVAGTGDVLWDDVCYLAKWEGTDAATAYTELAQSDVQNFYGNAQLDTAQMNFGSASLLMDGTADGVQSTDDDGFKIGTTDDATVEGFVRWASLPTNGNDMQLVNQAQQDVNNHEMRLYNNAGSYQLKARFGFGNTPVGNISTPTLDTWYHFAAVRTYNGASTTVEIFFNGTRASTTVSANNPSQSVGSVPITIGAWDNVSDQTFTDVLDGHIDDVRITKAVRYTGSGSYTIPASDFDAFGTAASEAFTVGDPGYVTNIEGSEVQINGVAIDQNATHTGEVTGSVALAVDVTAITNQTDVVADAADDVPIHDDSDGTLKKVNLSSITDGGYF
jgi:hypothetical protein